MQDRTILVTGATGGLGLALSHRLAADGARVVLHGRDEQRTAAARDEVAATSGNADRLAVATADLSDLAQVRALADAVATRFDRLDVLVNNAGVGGGPPEAPRVFSADGIELRFAVNYLAGYRLTRLLLPTLRSAAPARIISVASAGQHAIDFADPMLDHDYTGMRAYAQSKLAQIMFTLDLAAELPADEVTANALHPATFMNTRMVREAAVTPVSTVADGVEATARLVGDPALDGVTGEYFHGTRPSRALDEAYDPGDRAKLRELSERLIGQAAT
nr:SDR family NAD(P)-dependent oxidoreductase [Saccharopolyspora sp. HNM0983]